MQDTIDDLVEQIRNGAILKEVVEYYVDTSPFEEHERILKELGDRDLSIDGENYIDLSLGWIFARAQLAYNALILAVNDAMSRQ